MRAGTGNEIYFTWPYAILTNVIVYVKHIGLLSLGMAWGASTSPQIFSMYIGKKGHILLENINIF